MTPFLLRVNALTAPTPQTDIDRELVDTYVSVIDQLGVTPHPAASEADFYTQASILKAALDEVPRNRLWVTADDEYAHNLRGYRVKVSHLPAHQSFGSTSLSQFRARPEEGWWLSRTLHEMLTYDTIVTSFGGENDVADAMSRAWTAGSRQVHIRLLRKESAKIVSVHEHRHDNVSELVRAFGWRLAEIDGGIDDILLTPALDPTREFRAWIVKNALVTGAGIVPGLDPRANLGSALDLQNTDRRGGAGISVSDADQVEMLAEIARVLAEKNRDGDLPESFVLDLAWDGDIPTIIDVNDIDGSALYAADPARIIRALTA